MINAFIKNKLCTRCTLVNCEGQELGSTHLTLGWHNPNAGSHDFPFGIDRQRLDLLSIFDERDGDVSDTEGKLTLCVPFAGCAPAGETGALLYALRLSMLDKAHNDQDLKIKNLSLPP